MKYRTIKSTLLLIIWLIGGFVAAYAQDDRYNENLNMPQRVGEEGAVAVQSGSLGLGFTDIRLPGMGGLNLEVKRSYSSVLANLYNMANDGSNVSITTTHTPEDWKYGLGSGWTLGWPFIYRDIDDTSSIQKLNLFWDGRVYELDQSFSSDSNANNIKYYEVNDIQVFLDSSVQYTTEATDPLLGGLNNLGVSSRYRLQLKDGTRYYFSEAGNLMLIRRPQDPADIKAAEIWFYYQAHQVITSADQYEQYREQAKIELVTDSVGREIDFIYADNDENWLEEVRYPLTKEGVTTELGIKYFHENVSTYPVYRLDGENKQRETLSEGLAATDHKFVLSGYEDQLGLHQAYRYQVYAGEFSFMPALGNGINYFALLERAYAVYTNDLSERYRSAVVFEYNRPDGNWTQYLRDFSSGFMELFKVTRHYALNKTGELFNDTSYAYYGNSYEKSLSEYWSITRLGGLTKRYVYGSGGVETEDNLLKYQETEGNNGSFLERLDYVYDARKTLKAKSLYRSGVLKYTEEFIYDKHNDLINHKAPNGLVTETRYHQQFHLPEYRVQRGVKRGDGSSYDVEQEWELRASDGKVLGETVYVQEDGERRPIKVKSVSYDGYGNPEAVTDALGHTLRIEYEGTYHLFPEKQEQDVTLDGVLTTVKSFQIHNSDGTLWLEADNDGYAVEHLYDALGTEIKTVLPDEDDLRSITQASDLLSAEWRASRENNTFVEKVIDYQEESELIYGEEFEGSRVKQGKFKDGLGHLLKEVLYESGTSAVEYSVKRMSYDGRGNMIALTDADAGESFTKRQVMDQVVEVHDRTWLVWYDDLGRKTRVEYPDAGSRVVKKSITYNDRDFVVTTTNTKSVQTVEYYDLDGNLIKVVTPGVEDETGIERDLVFRYEYNQLKKRIGFTDPAGEVVRYLFDQRGQLVEQVYGNGSERMGYDDAGNLTRKSDRNGNLIRFEYDEMNRNIRREYFKESDLVTPYDAVELGYDGRGNLVKVSGNLLTESMVYDGRNRVKEIERSYGEQALRAELMNSLDWVNVDTEEQSFRFEFSYTPNDLVASTRLPNGKLIEYSYDPDKLRLATLGTEVNGQSQEIVSSLLYNKSGQVLAMGYGNGTRQSWEFDLRSRIKRTTMDNGMARLFDLRYQLDTEGNILSINDNQFAYDKLNRLVKSEIARLGEADYLAKVRGAFGTSTLEPVVGPYTYEAAADLNDDGAVNAYDFVRACQEWVDPYDKEAFKYDLNGNRRELVQNGKVYAYSYGERNKLLKIERDGEPLREYEYDANGNTTKRREYNGDGSVTEYEFSYDIHNRLLSVLKDGAPYTRYLYDNGGMRLYKEEGGKRTYYFRNGGSVNFEVEIGGADVKESSYLLSGELLAGRIVRENGGSERAEYYHLDHLNSTKAVTNQAGELELLYEYRAFGTELNKVGSGENHYSYIGREFDQELGLYYLNARYYDATLGRFITVDPAQDGANWYVYAGNNPLSFKDPSGLFVIHPLLRVIRNHLYENRWRYLGGTVGALSFALGAVITAATAGAGSPVGAMLVGIGVNMIGDAIFNKENYGIASTAMSIAKGALGPYLGLLTKSAAVAKYGMNLITTAVLPAAATTVVNAIGDFTYFKYIWGKDTWDAGKATLRNVGISLVITSFVARVNYDTVAQLLGAAAGTGFGMGLAALDDDDKKKKKEEQQ